MTYLAVFSAALMVAVLLSDMAARSILSTALIFLFAGFLAGNGVFGFIPLQPDSPIVAGLAELALFAVLFTDGARISLADLSSAWKLPGRALFFGMPLNFAVLSVLGHWIVGLAWPQALLIGAVLSPTDPVLAAAVVGREEIPWKLRHLLNVESGLNDGLALPVVIALLSMVKGSSVGFSSLFGPILLGIAIGVAGPWAASRIERVRVFSVAAPYGPLFTFAVGCLVLSAASLLQANEFLAAYAAGITMASSHPDLRNQFQVFGEKVTELFKLAALLVFGALISPAFLRQTGVAGYLFVLLALVAARPLTLLLALAGSKLEWRERVMAAWFGPKGFASVTFGLMIYNARIPEADHLFHLVALAVVISIIGHSSTDVLFARWLQNSP